MPRFEEVYADVDVDLNGTTSTIKQVPVDLDFEVFCGECGAGICHLTTTHSKSSSKYPKIAVGLCEACIDRIRDEAYDCGFAEGSCNL